MNSFFLNLISLEMALRAAALAQFAVAILNLFLIRIMNWKPDLDRAPLLIREVFQIHVVFISITLSIFALLTWRFVHEIASAANWLATAIGTFWIVRSVVQWLHYSSSHWRGNTAHSDSLDAVSRLWRDRSRLFHGRLLEKGMNAASLQEAPISDKTALVRERLLSRRGEPLFYAKWDNVLFIHYETEPDELQRGIPYSLDLYHDRAFVSLVAFTMRGMRPRLGGTLGALLFKLIATHHFLNVRTYVRHNGEAGIYFMREWLSNRMAVLLGPRSFGLPYRFGRIEYEQEQDYRGRVEADEGSFRYWATLTSQLARSAPASLDEFLLERYTAFTQSARHRRFFRIWHEPWQQASAKVEIVTDNLIGATESWWQDAHRVGANYSPGVNVWMGWPHRIHQINEPAL